MATKDKKSATKVTRIKASDSTPKKETPSEVPVAETKSIEGKGMRNPLTPIKAIGRYFGGAWYELKQVRWPNRRATWGMTGAMLGFTAFFIVLILLLDALFKYLFDLILG